MKTRAISLFILILCSHLILLQGCHMRRAPKVVFENRTHEFPEFFIVGSEITTSFTFTNEGHAPLQIAGIEADCGCVAINTAADRIPPGGTGMIRVDINRDVGRFLQNVHVYTNDPVTPIVNLQVSGEILPAIAYPKHIRLGKLKKGERVPQTISLVNNTANAVEITHHTVSDSGISVTIPEKTIPAGSRTKLEAVLQINRVGFYNASLTLGVTDAAKSELVIQFSGHVQGGIRVVPANLFLGVVSPSSQSIQREIQIKTDGENAFSILSISAETFDVSAEVPTQPQTVHDVVLSFSMDESLKGLVSDTVRIATDYPDVPQIDIHVKGVLQ